MELMELMLSLEIPLMLFYKPTFRWLLIREGSSTDLVPIHVYLAIYCDWLSFLPLT